MSSSKTFRPLLPNGEAILPARQRTGSISSDGWNRPKRSVVAACNACRRRKSKCNAERPKCLACVKNHTTCDYETAPSETRQQAMKRKHDALEGREEIYHEFFNMIRSRSSPDAANIVKEVRAGRDVESIVTHIRDGDLLLQLATTTTATRRRNELGDLIRIPEYLQSPKNPYLDSLICKSNFDSASASPRTSGSSSNGAESMRMYNTPYHTVRLVEPRLDDVKPSSWTAVVSDDEYLRKLLAGYFLYDYPFFSFFHKDYFLEDMNRDQERFCSSLLVNAVLVAACYADHRNVKRAQFWDPESLGYRFLAETKRLWELKDGRRSITDVQAALVLHLIYTKNGLDRLGWHYLVQAIAMAEDLYLFTAYVKPKSRPWCTVQSMTAWAIFGWQSVYSFHFQKPPLLRSRPDIALPEDPNIFGEVWIQYPLTDNPTNLHYGELFRATISFRAILNDVMCRRFDKALTGTPLDFNEAMEFRTRLFEWHDSLPAALLPNNIALPVHFAVQYVLLCDLPTPMCMDLHHLMVSLFQPLLASEDHCTQQDTAREIITIGKICMATLLRLYYCCHGDDTYDVWMAISAVFVGLNATRDLDDVMQTSGAAEALHSTILLCAHTLCIQARNFYLSEAFFHVLRRRMSAEDLRLLREDLASEVDGDDKREVAEERMAVAAGMVQSDWPVPMGNGFDGGRLSQVLGQLESVMPEEALSDNSSVFKVDGERRGSSM